LAQAQQRQGITNRPAGFTRVLPGNQNAVRLKNVNVAWGRKQWPAREHDDIARIEQGRILANDHEIGRAALTSDKRQRLVYRRPPFDVLRMAFHRGAKAVFRRLEALLDASPVFTLDIRDRIAFREMEGNDLRPRGSSNYSGIEPLRETCGDLEPVLASGI
jgi:hypothetical protein